MFSSIKRGWSFIKEAFSMAFSERRLLRPSVYLVLATIIYYLLFAVGMVAAGIQPESDAAKALGVVALFGSFLIFYFFMGMTVHVIDKYLEDKPFTMGEAFRDAMQNFVAISVLALISTAIELLAKAGRNAANQRGGAAIVGHILIGIVEFIWTTVSFLLLPIIIIEDAGFFTSLGRARDIAKGNIFTIGVGEVGVRLVLGILSFVVLIPVFFLVPLLMSIGGMVGIILTFVVVGTLISLLAAFNVFIRMAYYTCLYHWAVSAEQEGATASLDNRSLAPGPLRGALGTA